MLDGQHLVESDQAIAVDANRERGRARRVRSRDAGADLADDRAADIIEIDLVAGCNIEQAARRARRPEVRLN